MTSYLNILKSKMSIELNDRVNPKVKLEAHKIKEDILSERDILERYTYMVMWSSEDNMYIGLCSEMPSLSWMANSHDEALKGIHKAVYDSMTI